MSQTKLLWELENHNRLLDKYKKQLQTLKNDPDLQRIVERHKNLEEKLLKEKDTNAKLKKRIKEKENTLKDYSFYIEELDKKLYSNQMSDFKQLDYLIQEKEKFKLSINDLEVEIINLLDEVESIDKETSQLEVELVELSNTIAEYKKRKLEAINKISQMIKNEENKLNEYNQLIEPKIMSSYKSIKGSKTFGVAQVLNGVCSGCNMLIPAYLIDEANSKKDLVTCENCGRILFIGEQE